MLVEDSLRNGEDRLFWQDTTVKGRNNEITQRKKKDIMRPDSTMLYSAQLHTVSKQASKQISLEGKQGLGIPNGKDKEANDGCESQWMLTE